jgi:apolipoprotein N-acyltransferase
VKRRTPSRNDWLLIAAGALLNGLAYPPFHLLIPSFICLIPAVWLLGATDDHRRGDHGRLARGFWLGVITAAVVLHWMPVALWRFAPLAVLGFPVALLIGGGQGAVLFGVIAWVRRVSRVPMVLVFPTVWTALEWLGGHLGELRFPWLGLGTSLTGFPLLVQIADVTGARGVTWLLAAANVTLAAAWPLGPGPHGGLRRLGAVLLGVGLAGGYGAWRSGTVVLRSSGTVALVQTALAFDEGPRHDPDWLMSRLIDQTAVALSRPVDLVVWPEAAVPGELAEHPEWEIQLAQLARRHRTALLVGAPEQGDDPAGGPGLYNAAVLVDTAGRVGPTYRKRYLVPLVERVPRVVPGWPGGRGTTDYQPGSGGDPLVGPIGLLGTLICFESSFENLAREHRRRGADLLVNLTNDAWLSGTGGPAQHPAHLVMRAIENRVAVARVANAGVSGVIDPLGRWRARTPSTRAGVVVAQVYTSDQVAPYVRLGDWVGWLSLGGTVALLVGAAVRDRQRATALRVADRTPGPR